MTDGLVYWDGKQNLAFLHLVAVSFGPSRILDLRCNLE